MAASEIQPRIIAAELDKPEIDKRSYRIIELPNKVEVVLIHDADTDSASVALSVGVGCYTDDKDMQGIAHAIEHMITMGSEKYPSEGEYEKYLTKHGGGSNAMTIGSWTCYFCQVNAVNDSPADATAAAPDSSPLYGALDIFSQFFTHPLLREDMIPREMKAVDSEFDKNKLSDMWRERQVSCALSNPEHPRHGFMNGNYKTLYDDPLARGENLRERFLKWYKTHYSADRMKLALFGRESLDQLQEWATKFFGHVENKSLGPCKYTMPVYTDREMRKQVFIKSIKDVRRLAITFPIPDQSDDWEALPDHYISFILGHEGKGSLFAYLKKLGWATSLAYGSTGSDNNEPCSNMEIGLTPLGFEKYRDVTKAVFQFLGMMTSQGPQQRIFDENQKLQEIAFRFQQNSSAEGTTIKMATLMQRPVDRARMLKASSVPSIYDPQKIEKLMTELIPQRVVLTLSAQQHNVELDQREDIYGIDYHSEDIPAEFMAELQRAYDDAMKGTHPEELHLPEKNELIPEDLTVEPPESDEPEQLAPRLIRNDLGVRTWWKKDRTFLAPKALICVRLRSGVFAVSPFTETTTQLYEMLIQYVLNEYAYDASVAGLEYQILVSKEGIILVVEGYNDKLIVLLERMIDAFVALDFSTDDFGIMKHLLEEQLRNMAYSPALAQARRHREHLTVENIVLPEEQLEIVKNVTEQDVHNLSKYILRQAHIEVLAYGNLTQQVALRATEMIESKLKPIALPVDHWPPRRMIEIPAGTDYIYRVTSTDANDTNQAITYDLYLNDYSDASGRAKAQLFATILADPIFDDLRTKQQLGYIVQTKLSDDKNPWCLTIEVQSTFDTEYLEARIEDFLTRYEKTLEDMSDEAFESSKSGLIGKFLRRMENMRQEMARMIAPMAFRSLDFETRQTDAKTLRSLTKADILDLYRTKIKPGSHQRSKLVVQLMAQTKEDQENTDSENKDPMTDSAEPLKDAKVPEDVVKMPRVMIDDVRAFRSAMSLAPMIRPVKALHEFEA